MKIILANDAGFCFGVKRAVKMAEEEINKSEHKIYSLGPLIHNPQLVEKLEKRGLKQINSDDINNIKKGKIIIRSHGISKYRQENILKNKLELVDTTCPYVKSVHKRVANYYNKNYDIIIIGDSNHPEVKGINGWCNNKAYIVNSIEDVEKLNEFDKICIVSQTTNTQEKFNLLSEKLKSKSKTIEIFNTICEATKNRQNAARDLANIVDAMIVIGGYESSNTKKLVEISKIYCKNVFHIQTIEDLTLQDIQKFNTIGVTAGASTPDWIIKEAIKTMDNFNNDEMMEAINSSFTNIHKGEVIDGKIIFVTNDEVMVNINYKSDGIITRDELSNDENVNPRDLFSEGQKIKVYVMRMDDGEGNVVLSTKRVEAMKKWDELQKSYEDEEVLDAKVQRVVKGGLIANIKGLNGFIPASHASANYISDLEKLIGQEFKVKILDFDKEKRRIILSRKEIEKIELAEKKKAVWEKLEEGMIVEGTVQRLTDFGAFVDLGGVDGLIHISDLSWNRIKHPSKIVNPGDKVEVLVLSLDEAKNRISLGLKQMVEEPWETFKNNCNIGDILKGKVVNLLDFGAFIRLYDGVDGLLHVSQISQEHVDKPSDVLSIDDEVRVKILDINYDDKKISLSIKEIEEEEQKEIEKEEEQEADVTIGDIVSNKE